MLTILKSLVIPLLLQAKYIQIIEAIQQTFTYKITKVQHLNYRERLHKTQIISLKKQTKLFH